MTKAETFKEITEKMLETYIEKNKQYGDSYSKTYKEYGNTVLLLRIDDKLQRLKSLLLRGNADTFNESVQDTFFDLAIYAVMAIIETEKETYRNVYEFTTKEK